MKSNETDSLMTVDDLVEYLQMGERTVRRYIAKRRVPFARIEGHIRFRRSEIDRWIDSRTVRPTKGTAA